MLITILSIIIAAAFIGYTDYVPTQIDSLPLAVLIGLGGTLMFFVTSLFYILALAPLERLEQKLIPNLVNLFRRDKILGITRLLLFLFPIISFLFVVLMFVPSVPQKFWFFLVWVILFGLAIDLFRDSWKRMMNYLNPSFLVKILEKDAISAIVNGEDERLWNSIDGISEIGLRSIDNSKIALCTQAIQTFPPILKVFFDASKSISRMNQDEALKKQTGTDEASYTVFYVLQHLELINDRALKYRFESILRNMVMSLGKIIVYSAKFDLSMVSFPTHFLSKFGLKAQQHHFDEVADLTTSTLLEVAKTIITEIDITYMELQEAFRSIINGLDALAKATFQKNKNTSIAVLIEPFQQLRALFLMPKMANHPDTPVILAEIDRVLAEYDTLDKVMRAIPPIPDLAEDIGIPPLPPGA